MVRGLLGIALAFVAARLVMHWVLALIVRGQCVDVDWWTDRPYSAGEDFSRASAPGVPSGHGRGGDN